MKLWDKGYRTADLIHNYTVGNDRKLDEELAIYDVEASVAHAKMLMHIGILSEGELKMILAAFSDIKLTIENGDFKIESNFEDVHSKIEFLLIEMAGECGKKIHTARSRNDQVLVDLHLYAKDQLSAIENQIGDLFHLLIALSEKHKDILMPGYTHTQIAMPSSFGLWFGAYAESLVDDLVFIKAAKKIADQNPLGSAAGYGSSFPINRTMTTKELNFSTMKFNSIAAQMSRGKLEKSVAFGLSSVAGTLGRMATDICLFMSQNFGFVSFPKELTTGSSIMPHKQNPDVFELMRAKSNQIQNLPQEIGSVTQNLTSGYHRDLQLLKGSFMNGIQTTQENLEVCLFMLQQVEVNPTVLDDKLYDSIFSVEAVNELVLEGMSFRDAYVQIGKAINTNEYEAKKDIAHTHEGSIGNLCNDLIVKKFKDFSA